MVNGFRHLITEEALILRLEPVPCLPIICPMRWNHRKIFTRNGAHVFQISVWPLNGMEPVCKAR